MWSPVALGGRNPQTKWTLALQSNDFLVRKKKKKKKERGEKISLGLSRTSRDFLWNPMKCCGPGEHLSIVGDRVAQSQHLGACGPWTRSVTGDCETCHWNFSDLRPLSWKCLPACFSRTNSSFQGSLDGHLASPRSISKVKWKSNWGKKTNF